MLRYQVKDDIRLKNSPLVDVICQVRFPSILRIGAERPVELQEVIRKNFPEIEIDESDDTPVFRFKSLDGFVSFSLTSNFFALSTTSYTTWSDYLGLLSFVSQSICKVYNPEITNRIGLRYINHLTLENTNTKSIKELLDILRPELTVLLRGDQWDMPKEMLNRLLLSINDGTENLAFRFGFKSDGDPTFLLDYDYYSVGNMPFDDLEERCQRYHEAIYNAFRWSIKEEKLHVFSPIT